MWSRTGEPTTHDKASRALEQALLTLCIIPQELFQLQEKNHIPQKSHFSGHALNTATFRAEKVKQGHLQEMVVLLEYVNYLSNGARAQL